MNLDYRAYQQIATDSRRAIASISNAARADGRRLDPGELETVRVEEASARVADLAAITAQREEQAELRGVVAGGHPLASGPEDREQVNQFYDYLHTGVVGTSISDLGIDTGGSGEYLVPEPILAPLAERARATNPIMAGAFHWDLTGHDATAELPIKTNGVAGHASELATRTETTEASFSSRTVSCREIYSDSRISTQWLDSVPNAEALVTNWAVGDLWDVFEADCAAGSGSNGATGLFSAAAAGIFQTVFSGSAATLLNTSPYKLVALLNPKYAQSAVWLMNQATLAILSGFAMPSNANIALVDWSSNPPTMYGIKIMLQTSAPSVGAGVYCLALADLANAYVVAQHRAPGMLRDPFTASGTGQIRYFATMRIDGQPWNPEAAVLCRCSTV